MLQAQERETTAAEVFGHNVRRYREKQGMSRFRLAINAVPLEALQPAFDRLPLAEQGRVLAVLRLLLQVSKE